MGFHDAEFPENLSYGTKGGAGFRSTVVESDGGGEVRASEWDARQSRIEFDVAKTIQTRPEASAILHHAWCMRGAALGFRFKDVTDWSTSALHNILPNVFNPFDRTPLDGARDGVNQVFKLQKLYPDVRAGVGVASSFLRRITKPIPPGHPDYFLVYYVNGGPVWVSTVGKVPGSPFEIATDFDSGTCIWTPAPPPTLLEAAFTFHVPARFGQDVDDRLSMSWTEASGIDFDSVSIIGQVENRHTGSEEHWLGGADNVLPFANPHTLGVDTAYHQRILGTFSPTLVINVPKRTGQVAEEFAGGPHYLVENASSAAITLVTENGPHIANVAVGSVVELYWIDITQTWKAR